MKLPFKVDLSNEVVAITGAGGVLMSEFAKALAACGAKVAVMDISDEGIKRTVDAIEQDGGIAIGVKTNCLIKAEIEEARKTIEEKLGEVTLLVNGAGGNSPKATCDNEYMSNELSDDIKSFFDLDEQGFRFVFDLNIMSAVYCSQVFAKKMSERRRGNIINISSMNAYRPLTKIPAYSAAKAGVSNFTEWLAVHFAPVGIRCNAIAPGFFATNQNRSLLFNEDGTPTARTGKILRSTPMNRFGETSDLLGALLYLASDQASGFVTGICIAVDGGFNAYSGV